MKQTYPVKCACGEELKFVTYGSGVWPSLQCAKCLNLSTLSDPLVFCGITDRILFRAAKELQDGDATFCIIMSAMAVETILRALFFELSGPDSKLFTAHSNDQLLKLEKEFRKLSGFAPKVGRVLKLLGSSREIEIAKSPEFEKLFTKEQLPEETDEITYIEKVLFRRRNRILHQGDVNFSTSDAQEAKDAAVVMIRMVRGWHVSAMKQRVDDLRNKMGTGETYDSA